MPLTQDFESFRGESWKECSDFIQAVRVAAWKEGKLRDRDWMADYASILLADDALAWYSLLPQDIQEDWQKLQTALVKQWSSKHSDDSNLSRLQCEPAAAPASPPKGSEKTNHLDCGVIRAIAVGKDEPLYVQDIDVYGVLKNSAEGALRLRFESEPTSKILECVDDLSHSWLAIHWNASAPNLGRKSTHFAYLVKVDSETLGSSWGPNNPFQIARCKVSRDGEITFVWRNGRTETSLTAFTNSDQSGLYLAADPNAYQRHRSTDKRVMLVLETTT